MCSSHPRIAHCRQATRDEGNVGNDDEADLGCDQGGACKADAEDKPVDREGGGSVFAVHLGSEHDGDDVKETE